jgi:tetratricopeptide (TPR) repeat protein
MSESFTRALMFVKQGRYREAEPLFRQAIEIDPEDPQGFFFLATCLMHDPRRRAEALSMINEALRLCPSRAFYHAQRANILVLLSQTKEALREINEARRLAPDSPDSYVAESVVNLALGKPQQAELAARQALVLDPENEAAGDTLGDALRLQGKLEESETQIHNLLAKNPENPWAHSSAGFVALEKGDVSSAERSFLAALRIDAEHQEARSGLLHAFRARAPFYRAYLRYSFMMERLDRVGRGFVVIGLLVLLQITKALFSGPLEWLGFLLVALYLLFVLWVWVARSVGNLFLLTDPFARHALRKGEIREAIVAGGGALAGLAVFGAGLLAKQDALMFFGLTLVGATFPMSLVFTNRSKAGQVVFGAAGAAVYLGGFASVALLFVPQDRNWAANVFEVAMLFALLTTWIGNIPALRR